MLLQQNLELSIDFALPPCCFTDHKNGVIKDAHFFEICHRTSRQDPVVASTTEVLVSVVLLLLNVGSSKLLVMPGFVRVCALVRKLKAFVQGDVSPLYSR